MLESLKDFYTEANPAYTAFTSILVGFLLFVALFSCLTLLNNQMILKLSEIFAPLILLVLLSVSLFIALRVRPNPDRWRGILALSGSVLLLILFGMML